VPATGDPAGERKDGRAVQGDLGRATGQREQTAADVVGIEVKRGADAFEGERPRGVEVFDPALGITQHPAALGPLIVAVPQYRQHRFFQDRQHQPPFGGQRRRVGCGEVLLRQDEIRLNQRVSGFVH